MSGWEAGRPARRRVPLPKKSASLLGQCLRNIATHRRLILRGLSPAHRKDTGVHIHSSRAMAAIPLMGLLVFGSALSDTPATPATPAAPAPAAPPAPKPQPKLNLKIPDVNRTLTPAQRRAAMGPNDTDKAGETVEVQRQRAGDANVPPKPPGGLASVFWAVAHPIEAWRIFFPVPPEQRGNDEAPRNN